MCQTVCARTVFIQMTATGKLFLCGETDVVLFIFKGGPRCLPLLPASLLQGKMIPLDVPACIWMSMVMVQLSIKGVLLFYWCSLRLVIVYFYSTSVLYNICRY